MYQSTLEHLGLSMSSVTLNLLPITSQHFQLQYLWSLLFFILLYGEKVTKSGGFWHIWHPHIMQDLNTTIHYSNLFSIPYTIGLQKLRGSSTQSWRVAYVHCWLWQMRTAVIWPNSQRPQAALKRHDLYKGQRLAHAFVNKGSFGLELLAILACLRESNHRFMIAFELGRLFLSAHYADPQGAAGWFHAAKDWSMNSRITSWLMAQLHGLPTYHCGWEEPVRNAC